MASRQAEGFLHVFEGWVIFLCCIAVLFGMAKAMQRLSGDRRRLGEALDLDFSGLGAELGRIRGVEASAALVAAARPDRGAVARLRARPRARRRGAGARGLRALPAERRGRVGRGWEGRSGSLAPAIAAVLGADDYLAAVYAPAAGGAPVDLFLTWYADQTDGNAIHSPAVCLPGAGWEVAAIRRVTVPLPGTATGSAAAEPGGDPQGAGDPARLLLVRRPRPADHQRLRRQVLARWPTACGSAAPTAAWCG